MNNHKERQLTLTYSLGPPRTLYFDGNRVDLLTGTNQTRGPFGYEAHCFREISQDENNENGSLLLGPGFIDHVISRAMPQLSRPDVIRLDATPNTSLTLTQLFEIKSGKNITPLRKIRGFSKLLREWRKKPDFLQTLLQSSLIDFDFEVNQ